MLFFQENAENGESTGFFYQINKSTSCSNIYFSRDGTFFKKQVRFIEKQHNSAEKPRFISLIRYVEYFLSSSGGLLPRDVVVFKK